MNGGDILQKIPNEDLPVLRELYRGQQATAPHVFSLLTTAIAWKKRRPDADYLTFFGVHGDDWKRSGTFILLMQYTCYDLFVFTLQDDCEVLYKGLIGTKTIDFSRKLMWYAVLSKHLPTLFNVIEDVKSLSLSYHTETGLWVIDKEEALKFEINIPNDVYIKQLNKSHVLLINTHWPHRYPGSEGYLSTFIEMNACYGLFLKSDDSLASWVLKNHLGQLGILQTIPEHTRKGYASLVTKYLSKEIAEEGHHPLGTVLRNNGASEAMFRRLGFRSIDVCTFVGCNDGAEL